MDNGIDMGICLIYYDCAVLFLNLDGCCFIVIFIVIPAIKHRRECTVFLN